TASARRTSTLRSTRWYGIRGVSRSRRPKGWSPCGAPFCWMSWMPSATVYPNWMASKASGIFGRSVTPEPTWRKCNAPNPFAGGGAGRRLQVVRWRLHDEYTEQPDDNDPRRLERGSRHDVPHGSLQGTPSPRDA